MRKTTTQSEKLSFPDDWRLGKLSDFGIFRSGNGFPLVFQGHRSGDYPFFKVSDLSGEGNELFMQSANHYISEEIRRKLGATRFQPGSIVFAHIGAAIFLERKRLLSQECCLDNNMMAFTIMDNHAYPRFFYYLFLHLELGKLVSTTALPALSGRHIGEISVPVPSPAEQRAIAEVLSDVDGLLNALEALIAKKRAIKQATMQQLLTGRTRLPGFSGVWEKTKMGNIGSIYGGLSGKSKVDFGGGNARYVTFLGVLENVVLDVRHTEQVYVGQGESQNSVMKGDLLFNASSETPEDLAIGAVMGEQLDNLYLNSFCFGFRVREKNKHVPLFLAYFFRGSVGRAIMNALAQGATRYNMSKSQFLALELSVPSYEEQHAIVSVLSDMDAEIAALEQRRDKTRAIKQGMMQQLLTGRVRLL